VASEVARAIEDELVKHGCERYSFDHSKKHAAVTFWLGANVKFYTFPKNVTDRRMKLNIVADIRRWCKAMKDPTNGDPRKGGLTRPAAAARAR
jgi:hypothetical protein